MVVCHVSSIPPKEFEQLFLREFVARWNGAFSHMAYTILLHEFLKHLTCKQNVVIWNKWSSANLEGLWKFDRASLMSQELE